MFPICDRFGQPIAWSGRLLPEAERRAKLAGLGVGKYINSSDTPLYKKSLVVWNLHRAKAPAREAKQILVMEGPTDVMAADQAGIPQCAAVLGCRLTADHAQQLARTVGEDGRVVLVLDGDTAGQEGAEAGGRIALQAGVPVHVALMPDGCDPSELLLEGIA